jgi:hypothetical protein
MVQTFDLQKMGLTPITNLEMQENDGGNFWSTLKTIAEGIVVGLVIAAMIL